MASASLGYANKLKGKPLGDVYKNGQHLEKSYSALDAWHILLCCV